MEAVCPLPIGPAFAGIITFQIDAGHFSGRRLSGVFGYDTSVPDSDPRVYLGTVTSGEYVDAGFFAGRVSGGPQSGAMFNLQDARITTTNGPYGDEFALWAGANEFTLINIQDVNGEVLSTDALPPLSTTFNLESAHAAVISLADEDIGRGGGGAVGYAIDSITPLTELMPGESLFRLDVKYTNPSVGTLRDSVTASFLLAGDSNATSFGSSNVLFASLAFGDATWGLDGLGSFSVSASSGIVDSLSYSFAPLSTAMFQSISASNFPLTLTGIDIHGGRFEYEYAGSTGTLTTIATNSAVTPVPEPSTFALSVVAIVCVGLLTHCSRLPGIGVAGESLAAQERRE